MTSEFSVDSGGRFLRRDGKPWFLLGDTAWELFHRLDRADAEHYLGTRARQGFNTILAVGIAEFGGLDVPNAHGDLPLIDRDSARPDERYWAHVDFIVRTANELGLVVGLLPCWGEYWSNPDQVLADPVRAQAFARWIASRYADAEVLWVLGGDRNVTEPWHRATVDAFAAGIRSVVGVRQLITYHPRESSKDELDAAPWLDFDLVQSGHHGWAPPNYQLIEQDRGRAPRRPVLDGEPCYEAHPVMDPRWRPLDWSFTEADARRAILHAAFAGAAGHVYGATGTYQMASGEPDPISGATVSWRQALELPGATQVVGCARLLGALGFADYEPRQDLITARLGFRGGHVRAMARIDGTGAAFYLPWGKPAGIDVSTLEPLSAGAATARWWDPRAGDWHGPAEQLRLRAGRGELSNPFPGDDGVLVLTSSP